MSDSPLPEPAAADSPPVVGQGGQLATSGLVISGLGLAGWLTVLILMLAYPHEEYSGDGQRDFFISIGNFFNYLFRVFIGLVGLSINGTLSLIGITLSLSAYSRSASPQATSGLLLGLFGISIGALLILWRMAAWGVFGG